MGGRRRGEEIQGTPSAASRSGSGRGATRADAAPPCAQPGPTYHRSYDNCSKRVLRVVGMGLCGAFLVGVSGYVVVRDPTRSYVKPRGRTPSALCCLMTSESFGCHNISRHRWGASARWESRCFGLSEGLPASSGCTARGWGATGGGLGVLVVGGTFVQYAQPFASGSRPSFSRPTRADSGQLWAGPASSHHLQAPAAGDGQGTVGTDLSRRRRALPQEPRTRSCATRCPQR